MTTALARARLVAGLVVLALVASACSFLGHGGSYMVKAQVANGVGLYDGNPVTELGIPIGVITNVANDGSDVIATLRIQDGYPLPASARADVIGESVLGQRYIQFSPAYTGGAKMADGYLVPITRTSVPVSTDQLLSSLKGFLGQINPASATSLVTNLAQVLQGQGAQLNALLHNAAGTVSLLAAKGNDLGQLNGALAQLTGTLRTRDQAIVQLIDDYNTVSGVLARNGAQLGGTIDELNQASYQLASLLAPNLSGLRSDIAVITQAGRTLDRNMAALDGGLKAAPALFTDAARAVDLSHNWLRLNLQTTDSTTGGVAVGRVRDLLAGVCRRLLAHHAAGLPASTIANLARCGNPNSGFFDPILNLVPQILANADKGPPSPTTIGQMVQKGLAHIPGLGQANRAQISHALVSPPPRAPTTTSPRAPTTTAPPSLVPPLSHLLPPLPAPRVDNSGGGGLLGHLVSVIGGGW